MYIDIIIAYLMFIIVRLILIFKQFAQDKSFLKNQIGESKCKDAIGFMRNGEIYVTEFLKQEDVRNYLNALK
jgi:hypothetical protein